MPLTDEQRTHLATVPPSAARIVERAYCRTGGRMNAIKAQCLHCTGYERTVVRNCTALLCPLHPWRPYQLKADGQDLDDDFDPDLDDPRDEDDDWEAELAAALDDDDEL